MSWDIFRPSTLTWLSVLALLQGCHCWGWYHYHNCYTYLGAPPGAKTYGYGCCSDWPYGTAGPIPTFPAQYSLYPQASYETAPSVPTYESAPMPRLHGEPAKPVERPAPDLLIPPPRKIPNQSEPIPPPPLPPENQRLGSDPGLHRQPLQVRFQAPSELALGQSAQVRVTLANRSHVTLQDVELVLHLPKVIAVGNIKPPGQVRGNEISWHLPYLGPGGQEMVSVDVRGRHTANAAVCHVTALAADGTGAATSWALRIVPGE